jgi:hypothetical protein
MRQIIPSQFKACSHRDDENTVQYLASSCTQLGHTISRYQLKWILFANKINYICLRDVNIVTCISD